MGDALETGGKVAGLAGLCAVALLFVYLRILAVLEKKGKTDRQADREGHKTLRQMMWLSGVVTITGMAAWLASILIPPGWAASSRTRRTDPIETPVAVSLWLQCLDPNDPGATGQVANDELRLIWTGEGTAQTENGRVEEWATVKGGETAQHTLVEPKRITLGPDDVFALRIMVQEVDEGSPVEDVFNAELKLHHNEDGTAVVADVLPGPIFDRGEQLDYPLRLLRKDESTAALTLQYDRPNARGAVHYQFRLTWK